MVYGVSKSRSNQKWIMVRTHRDPGRDMACDQGKHRAGGAVELFPATVGATFVAA